MILGLIAFYVWGFDYIDRLQRDRQHQKPLRRCVSRGARQGLHGAGGGRRPAAVPASGPDGGVGSGNATLSWTTGAAGTSPITGYEYRQSTDSGDTWNPDWTAIPGSSATTTSYVVTGLNNQTGYYFGVRAVSDAGKGEESYDGVGSFSTPVSLHQNGRDNMAPWEFDSGKRVTYEGGSLEILTEYVKWKQPGITYLAPLLKNDVWYPEEDVLGYEVQMRSRWQAEEEGLGDPDQTWSSWEELIDEDDNSNVKHHTELEWAQYLSDQVFYPIEWPVRCEQREWRVRAIYWDPARHSGWAYTDRIIARRPTANDGYAKTWCV